MTYVDELAREMARAEFPHIEWDYHTDKSMERYLKWASAALSAIFALAGRGDQYPKLVRREPTREMIDAGCYGWCVAGAEDGTTRTFHLMHDAAPAVPEE